MNASRGWEIYPQIIFDMAMRIKNDYRNIPWFVAESGMGWKTKASSVTAKASSMTATAFVLSANICGTPCAPARQGQLPGYMLWAFTDNVSPMNAFKTATGLSKSICKTIAPGDPKPRRTGFVNWANGVNWCWISMMNTASRGQYLLR
ncbi:family 1 glycosylhydrolase [Klebsiella pneumoniae]|nr:family 1 glycosylhydrolase [Klebsiella pneumoniae]